MARKFGRGSMEAPDKGRRSWAPGPGSQDERQVPGERVGSGSVVEALRAKGVTPAEFARYIQSVRDNMSAEAGNVLKDVNAGGLTEELRGAGYLPAGEQNEGDIGGILVVSAVLIALGVATTALITAGPPSEPDEQGPDE